MFTNNKLCSDSSRFSKATMALLSSAGWVDERKVDTSKYEYILKSEGYPVHSSVISFLKSFGGLRVIHPHYQLPQKKR